MPLMISLKAGERITLNGCEIRVSKRVDIAVLTPKSNIERHKEPKPPQNGEPT